jgi:hypothetical protein
MTGFELMRGHCAKRLHVMPELVSGIQEPQTQEHVALDSRAKRGNDKLSLSEP